MRKKVNVGLIGAGRLGTMYAEFISQRVPNANFVAVADIVPDRASSCAEKFDVPKWYDNHHDLSADPNVDAVIVTATTTNHKEIVVDAAQENKPIFCEKPMTLSVKDAREMKQEIEKRGVFYQQGFQRRFDKGFSAGKKKIEEGVIGTPVVFRPLSSNNRIPETGEQRRANFGYGHS